MSVLRGLQDLLLKMGGTPVSGDNTDELVRKIADAYDPATQELPSVTSSDKDKYLHTNENTGALEWNEPDKELPSVTSEDKGKYLHTNENTGALEWSEVEVGGDGVFYFKLHAERVSGQQKYILDDGVTFDDIEEAYLSGKEPVLEYYTQSEEASNYISRTIYRFGYYSNFPDSSPVFGFYKERVQDNYSQQDHYIIKKSGNDVEITYRSNSIMAPKTPDGTVGRIYIQFVEEAWVVYHSDYVDIGVLPMSPSETNGVVMLYQQLPEQSNQIENHFLAFSLSECYTTYEDEEQIFHVIFSSIINDNGTLKLRKILLEEVGYTWDDLSDATVTITDTAL